MKTSSKTILKGILAAGLLVISLFAYSNNLTVPNKFRGLDNVYNFDTKPLSPAPKGYTPFYVSHYGRHGSRYAYSSSFYEQPNILFKAAQEQNNLTEKGKEVAARFFEAYPELMAYCGLLSDKGRDQHTRIAKRMYANFSDAFPDSSKVFAVSSPSMRSVISMATFCTSLQGCNNTLKIKMEQSPAQAYCTSPRDKSNFKPVKRTPAPDFTGDMGENTYKFLERTVDCNAILGRLFIDPQKAIKALTEEISLGQILWRTWIFASGMASQDGDYSFDDLFTLEEWEALWKADCFLSYKEHYKYQDECCQVVEDILNDCKEHAETKQSGAKLRFGHDHVLWPVLAIIGIDNFGYRPEKPEDAWMAYPTDRVPMASNLQFILYKNDKGDVLVKTLYCDEEMTIPGCKSVYCPWNMFEKHMRESLDRFPIEK